MKLTFMGMGNYEQIVAPSMREKVSLRMRRGGKTTALYKNNESDTTIMYFHGNGPTLNGAKAYLQRLDKNFDYNILAYDYPAYGESSGLPTQGLVQKTSRMRYDWLVDDQGQDPEQIILWGFSAGTAVASDLAMKVNFDSLILVSPYASRYHMATQYIGWIPQKYVLVPNSFMTVRSVQSITNKTLVVHGTDDASIPFWMGQEVFGNAGSEQKYFIKINGADHDAIITHKNKLLPYYKQFLSKSSLSKEEISLR